jgi:hypothetical protein
MPTSSQALTALLLLVLVGPVRLHAQGIRGVVLDLESEAPIAGATVSLRTEADVAVRRAVTDSVGGFSFPVSHTGRYHLRAERFGYATVDTPPLDLLAGDTAVVELRMGVDAVALAPLTVTAASRSRLRSRVLDEFYERKRRGWGRYMDPQEIDQLRPGHVSQLLHATPGIRIQYGRGITPVVLMRRMGGGTCVPTIITDGMRAPSTDIDAWVSGSSVRAVEVYSRAMEVPAEYASVVNWDCGAILIWTTLTVDG